MAYRKSKYVYLDNPCIDDERVTPEMVIYDNC